MVVYSGTHIYLFTWMLMKKHKFCKKDINVVTFRHAVWWPHESRQFCSAYRQAGVYKVLWWILLLFSTVRKNEIKRPSPQGAFSPVVPFTYIKELIHTLCIPMCLWLWYCNKVIQSVLRDYPPYPSSQTFPSLHQIVPHSL